MWRGLPRPRAGLQWLGNALRILPACSKSRWSMQNLCVERAGLQAQNLDGGLSLDRRRALIGPGGVWLTQARSADRCACLQRYAGDTNQLQ
jgi:hypothetical protein